MIPHIYHLPRVDITWEFQKSSQPCKDFLKWHEMTIFVSFCIYSRMPYTCMSQNGYFTTASLHQPCEAQIPPHFTMLHSPHCRTCDWRRLHFQSHLAADVWTMFRHSTWIPRWNKSRPTLQQLKLDIAMVSNSPFNVSYTYRFRMELSIKGTTHLNMHGLFHRKSPSQMDDLRGTPMDWKPPQGFTSLVPQVSRSRPQSPSLWASQAFRTLATNLGPWGQWTLGESTMSWDHWCHRECCFFMAFEERSAFWRVPRGPHENSQIMTSLMIKSLKNIEKPG